MNRKTKPQEGGDAYGRIAPHAWRRVHASERVSRKR